MIRKGLILRIFDAANILRWNDKMRPMEFTELDKQAHKMIIAYVVGKIQEEETPMHWIDVIEGGIFEFLERVVVTDLKPQIYYRIKNDKRKYRQLVKRVYEDLEPLIAPLGSNFCSKFQDYFVSRDTLAKRILGAAHFYASKWEFDFIERANPQGYEIENIKEAIKEEQQRYYDLKGVRDLNLYPDLRSFIDMCGELRFQIRWSHLPRLPRTSVLGHMLIVAMLSYLFSLEMKSCESRCINNYFTGLFHDFPEILTRDIISPVKSLIPALGKLIKEYEREEMEKNVYSLIKTEWHEDIQLFTEKEFESTVLLDGNRVSKTSDEISRSYNSDIYYPRDGELIRAVDDLAAFVEAYLSLRYGISGDELEYAKHQIRRDYRGKVIAGIDFGQLYEDFD